MQSENENVLEFNRFLQNNAQLLQDKYREYFTIDEIPIESIDSNIVVKFISDIFSFDRYHDPSTTNKISKSLTQNYEEYLKANPNTQKFNVNVAIDVLKFSIQNNQLFAVKYETKEKEQGENGESGENKRLIGEIHMNQNQFTEDIRNESPGGSESPHNRSQGSELKNSFDLGQNQFDMNQQIKVNYDPNLIKKNCKILFDYYCKEQMSLAQNLPFDRIQRESRMLTMNNLLLMAQLMNFYSSTITKPVLVGKFRKISEGKMDINYDKFGILFSQLQIVDPTLVARTQLNSPNIQKKLKSKKLPFNTQDTNPRQLVKNRVFKKKLTIHSGRMESDLLEDIRLLRQNKKDNVWRPKQSEVSSKQSLNIRQSVHRSYDNQSRLALPQTEKEDIITTKKLLENRKNLSTDLKMMNKIVTSQEDDDRWLGQYPIKLPSPSPPRYRQKSHQQQNARKDMIIQDLKKRIRELERYDRSDELDTRTRPYINYNSNVKRSHISNK